ncbi:MAG: SDR family oxidoreductase [Chitinophagaceae bacterium]|nr:SDR family oxidoreductase [Chitinophagaceae bacterium]
MNLSLQGKTAVVCGSTQGIGLAAAIEISKLGATCVLMARNEDALKEAILQLNNSYNQQHTYLVADFDKPDMVKQVIEHFVAQYTVHVLVNNSGGPAGGPITEATTDAFINTFNRHLICNHILTTAVMDSMKAAGFGRIINIISTSVKIPLPNLGVSNTIRGAVASWSKTMANELGQFNITVNNVLPGATNTQRLQSIIENNAAKKNKPTAEIEEEMKKEIPARRFAEANEVGNVIAFLASPAAAYINGVNIPVDGGRTGSM